MLKTNAVALNKLKSRFFLNKASLLIVCRCMNSKQSTPIFVEQFLKHVQREFLNVIKIMANDRNHHQIFVNYISYPGFSLNYLN